MSDSPISRSRSHTPGKTRLTIESRAIEALVPYERNARTHADKQIDQIAESIRAFDFMVPALVDGSGRIIAGHARVAAAKRLGMTTVPTISIDHLNEAQIRAFILADNKLAANAGWDHEVLALELQYLSDVEIDVDVTVTGFETPEIDILLDSLAVDAESEPGLVTASDPAIPTVTRPGDLWRLGRHRLLCGDATDAAAFKRLMGDRKAQMIFTDPPYNTPVDGHVRRRGQGKHAAFAMASGEMSEVAFTAFLRTVFGHLADHSVDGSLHFIFVDWRHLFELMSAGREVYSSLKNLCVWNKTNAGMGALYRSKHELILIFKNGTAPHINNVELGKNGRTRTNVWDYPGLNTLGRGRLEKLALHPTVKPVALVADAIRDCSRRGGVVLDPFVGSGTTIIAAEQTGRRAFAMEIDPAYVDTAIARFERETGHSAVHADTGETFSSMKAARATEGEAGADG